MTNNYSSDVFLNLRFLVCLTCRLPRRLSINRNHYSLDDDDDDDDDEIRVDGDKAIFGYSDPCEIINYKPVSRTIAKIIEYVAVDSTESFGNYHTQ